MDLDMDINVKKLNCYKTAEPYYSTSSKRENSTVDIQLRLVGVNRAGLVDQAGKIGARI